jgi:hypothetical protein
MLTLIQWHRVHGVHGIVALRSDASSLHRAAAKRHFVSGLIRMATWRETPRSLPW